MSIIIRAARPALRAPKAQVARRFAHFENVVDQ